MGATVCYAWAMGLIREWSQQKIQSKRIYQAIALAVQDQGFKLGVVCRLSPLLPSSLLNYLFAAMDVPFPAFILSTAIGVAPLALLVAYIGSLADDLADALAGGGEGGQVKLLVILALAVISTVLLVILLTFIGKREIGKALLALDALEAESLLGGATSTEEQAIDLLSV